MKLFNLLCAGALSALALTACTDNDDNSIWNNGKQAITFNASIQGANTRAVGNKWTAGDAIGIYMAPAGGELSAALSANKKYITDAAGVLSAASQEDALYYPSDGAKVDFVAYYPHTASIADLTYKVNVANQTDQPAIDLLYANNAKDFGNASTENPALNFTHQLSQIVFNITKDATVPSLDGLKVTFKGFNTTADFTLADGALANAATPADIAMKVDGATATAIVLPATGLADVKLVFELNGKSFEAAYPQTELAGGSKYVHSVKLSDSNGQPTVTLGAATITDWTEVAGGDIDVDFGEGGTVDPTPDPDPVETVVITNDAPYEEAFTTGQGKFTIQDVTIPTELTNGVWTQSAQYGMKASAYAGSPFAAESMLLSPMLDLTGVTKATLTFEHAINMTKTTPLSDFYKLLAKEDGAADWTELTMTLPETESWTFVSAGNIDLSAYVGKKVQIAMKYISTATNAGTWEIKNLQIYAGDVAPEPEPEPEPGTELINLSFETWTDAAPEGWGRASVTSATYSKSADAKEGSNSVSLTGSAANARFGSSDIKLAAGTYTLSAYAKNAAGTANFRMGWVPIVDGAPNSSFYRYVLDSTPLTNEWQLFSAEFTIDSETVVSIFFVNAKSNAGNDLLVDNVSLTKK